LADPATDELIVIVDGSTDGSIELLAELERDDDRLVCRLVENGGADRARQIGAEMAAGDLIVFIDDDVQIGPGTVTGHHEYHAKTDHAVLLGYMPVKLPLRRAVRHMYVYFYAGTYNRHVAQWEEQPSTILEHFWGGHFSMRRSDALVVGMATRGSKVTYHEDYVFGLRCRAAGLIGGFDRSLISDHCFTRGTKAFIRDAYLQGMDHKAMWEMDDSRQPSEAAAQRRDWRQRSLAIAARDPFVMPISRFLLVAIAAASVTGAHGRETLWARRLQALHQVRGRRDWATRPDLAPRVR
jgi:hypothetical protein